jgi:hypothetical protein
MPYYLIHRFGSENQPKFQKEEFSMEPQAVMKARELLGDDESGEFRIEDDEGHVIMTDRRIRRFCKSMKAPCNRQA